MVAGIFFAGIFPDCCPLQSLYGVLSAAILLLGIGVAKTSYGGRWLFGLGTFGVMFLIGWILAEHERHEVRIDWPSEEQAYRAVLLDTPIEKANSVQCKAEVNHKHVLLYLRKDSLASMLGIGDELLIYARIQIPQGRGNPYEFDYAHYLYHQGISGTAYVAPEYWSRIGRLAELPLKQQALVVREKAMQKYREWGVDEEQLPLLSALTLGCKRGLDDEVREVYADAGISHVLALSGMHIGIIWFLLDFLLAPISLLKGGRWLKWLLSTALLWGAAFVVGLEPSVVRAVIMCMLMELAKLSGARPLSMNTLAIAAFLMLFYHPSYLYDVGFQLSFVAVASIVLFRPLLLRVFAWKNSLCRYVGGVMAVSVAAQIGTAPLVMYYFSDFSVYFLITNLVAALWVPFMIYGAVAMAFFPFWPSLQHWIVISLNGLGNGLTTIARWVSEWPGATFSVSFLSSIEICLLYSILGLVWMYYNKQRRRILISGLLLCTCLFAVHLGVIFPEKKKAEMVFYNARNCPVVHLIESDGTSFLFPTSKEQDMASLKTVANTFWKREKIKVPFIVSEEKGPFNGIWKENIITWHGMRIGILSDDRWKNKRSGQLLPLDYLYLCRGFNQELQSLQMLFRIRTVVLDASLSRRRVERLKEECLKLGVDFVDLATEGSLRIFL